MKCLIDRSFKICNNWKSFYNNIENIKSNLVKNAYLPFLIDKVIKKYFDYKFSSKASLLIPCSSSEARMLVFNANFSRCKLLSENFIKREYPFLKTSPFLFTSTTFFISN